MKKIIRTLFLFILILVGYQVYLDKQKLKHSISVQNQYINNLHKEMLIRDSLCKDFWSHVPFGKPLEFIIVNSKFGFRRDPFNYRYKKHSGIDLKGTYRDTVYTTGAGFVETSKYYGGYGRCVVVNHGAGYKTLYGHLSKSFVKEGEFVLDKQPIGKVGNTGHSTGPHLHYEVIKNGESIDPHRFILVDFE